MASLLSVNNYYYSRGGAENVFLEHNRQLSEMGVHVVPFSMQHPQNLESEHSQHFIEELELSDSLRLVEKIRLAPKSIYSFEARKKIRNILRLEQIDIAHCHNIYHHLSPSILHELSRNNIPVVLTLHDLKIACPAYKMMSHDGVCERCKGGMVENVVLHRCLKDSLAISTLAYIEARLHKLLGSYTNCVDKFVVPSKFYRQKFIEWGWPEEKFTYIPNFIDPSAFVAQANPGEYFVYFGRLSEEKGVLTLLDAIVSSGLELLVVGTGEVESAARAVVQNSGAKVRFAGYQTGDALAHSIANARAVVVPSEWYENAPLSVMEAYAYGKPVIGANIGGIPELIKDGETGLVFESGSAHDLRQKLLALDAMSAQQIEQMGTEGRKWMERDFSHATYLKNISDLYFSLGVEI